MGWTILAGPEPLRYSIETYKYVISLLSKLAFERRR